MEKRRFSTMEKAASNKFVGMFEEGPCLLEKDAAVWERPLMWVAEQFARGGKWLFDKTVLPIYQGMRNGLKPAASKAVAETAAEAAAGTAAKSGGIIRSALGLPFKGAWWLAKKSAVPGAAGFIGYQIAKNNAGVSPEAKSGGTPAAVTVDDRSISDHQRSQGVGVFEGSKGPQEDAGSVPSVRLSGVHGLMQPQPRPWPPQSGGAPYVAPRPQANVQFRGYDSDTGKYDGWKIPDYVSQDLWPGRPANMNRGGRFYSHDNSVNELRRRMSKGEKIPMRLKAELMDNPHIGTDAEGG